jgi:ACS family tartrate transporter-like MFS transporter
VNRTADADLHLTDAGLEKSTMRKVMLRIVPVLMVSYFLAYLDRINIGFAALQMNKDLGLTSTAFGWAAGIFFIAYIVCEIPSNILMEKFCARFWIARIMVTWGLITAATAFVVGPNSLMIARFLLGAAEAGFFPGVILYVTYWCPAAHRAKVISTFSISIPLSGFFGSPISGAILGLDQWLGLHGWQWLFILEGLPASLVGLFVFFWLPNKPADAKWLTAVERNWLERTLRAEDARNPARAHQSLWRSLADPTVLLLGLISMGSLATGYGLAYWLPQMIKAFGLSDFKTGLVNAIPFGIAAIGMLVWAWHSDLRKERVWHTAIPLLTAAIGLAACLYLNTLWPVLIALCFALLGGYGVKGPFWALVSDWISPANKAAAIATVNSIASLSGFVGPFMIGYIKDKTGSYAMGTLPMILLALIGAAAVFITNARRSSRKLVAISTPAE